jgi:hypothetical protein
MTAASPPRPADPIGSLAFLAGFTFWDKLRGLLGFRTSAVLMLARQPETA